jgi:hypothetical protein
MSSNIVAAVPNVPQVRADNIPDILKGLSQWIVWRAGPLKANGKFDKVPIDPRTGRHVSAHDPQHWLSFADAMAAHQAGKGSGIGIVMSASRPIEMDGESYYLVGLDFDRCHERMDKLRRLRELLGKPYVEVSPSGNGLRMFALSKQPLKGGNSSKWGVELYADKQFLTVTGQAGRGEVKDATARLVTLDRAWFSPEVTPQPQGLKPNTASAPPQETPEEIHRVKDAIAYLSSDSAYPAWRDIVWAILWTGWSCAEDIARDWSKQAAHRYDDAGFDSVVHSFNPDGGITLGTLFHQARLGGWTPPAKPQHSNVPGIAGPGARRLLTAAEVKARPHQPYVVRGLLPAEGVAAIYGESGSGKSFLAMDLCFSIAAGRADWFGMAVKQAPAVYIALEGQGGVSKRVKAWEMHNQQQVASPVRFMVADFSIVEPEGVKQLGTEIVAEVGSSAVVVVDTLNQSAPGADENSSKDMSGVLTNAKHLADSVRGLVVLVHHTGKDRAKGMRGHSSLFAAMDAVIEVTHSAGLRSWSVAKSKDDEGGMRYDFRLVPYTVDVDPIGLPVTSCAVDRTLNLAVPQSKPKPLSGKNQGAAMAKLKGLLAANPAGVSEADAIAAVSSVLDCQAGRRTTVAKETIKGLAAGGHLNVDEGVVTLS